MVHLNGYIRTEIKDSEVCLGVRHVSAAWTRRMYEVPFLDLLLKDNVCNFWFFFYSLLSVGFTFLVNISSTITNRKRSWWLPGWLNPPLSGPAQIIATDRWLWDSGSFLCFLFFYFSYFSISSPLLSSFLNFFKPTSFPYSLFFLPRVKSFAPSFGFPFSTLTFPLHSKPRSHW